MLAAVALAAVTVRRRPTETRAVVALSVTAAAAAVVALVAGPTNIVPGLLVAFPLAAAGLLLDRSGHPRHHRGQGRRRHVRAVRPGRAGHAVLPGRRPASGAAGTSPSAFPIVVPVLLAAVVAAGRRLAPQARRVAAGSLVVILLALSAMAIGSLRANHGYNEAMNEAIRRATASIGGRPVVLAGNGTVARHGWPTFDDGRWLLASGDADRGWPSAWPPVARPRSCSSPARPEGSPASTSSAPSRAAPPAHLVRRRPQEAVVATLSEAGGQRSCGGRGGCPCGPTPPPWPSSCSPCCP